MATGPHGIRELIQYVRADYARTKGANPLNPSVTVVTWFRLSQWLWRIRLRPLAKLIEWHLVRSVACQLAPSAEVGPGLSLPHPLGIVLGGRTRLGVGVTLAQNVTLGSSPKQRDGRDQPTLLDGVWVSAGAVIAGPVVVGEGAKIGANTVVPIDVPAGAVVKPPHSLIPGASAQVSATQ